MGRGIATGPPPVALIRESFTIGSNSGQIVRRSTGDDAVHRGPRDQPLVRVYVDGRVRRICAARLAWCWWVGQWPRGTIRLRSDDGGYLESNLLLTPANRDPFGMISDKHAEGGKASALTRRQARNVTLINTLAANPGLTVPQISKLVGSSSPCTCVRLGKLADAGICAGPRCDSRARWDLTPAGRALAMTAIPPPDDLDKNILTALALAPKRQLQLVREVEACSLTVKRRAALLVRRGLVKQDAARQPFTITDAGLKTLGPDAPKRREPWVRPEAVAASTAWDVMRRHAEINDRGGWSPSARQPRAGKYAYALTG